MALWSKSSEILWCSDSESVSLMVTVSDSGDSTSSAIRDRELTLNMDAATACICGRLVSILRCFSMAACFLAHRPVGFNEVRDEEDMLICKKFLLYKHRI